MFWKEQNDMKKIKFCSRTVFLKSNLSEFNAAKAKLDLNGISYKTKVLNDEKATVLPRQGSHRSFGGNLSKYGNPISLYEILVRRADFELAKKIIDEIH